MTTEMPNPAEDLAEKLRKLLPGFEAYADARRDQVAVKGYLRIGASMDVTHLLYVPASDAPEVNRLTAIRIAEEAQRRGIEALGLESIMREREESARERGRGVGLAEGIAEGRRLGRLEVLRELQDAAELEEEDEFGL